MTFSERDSRTSVAARFWSKVDRSGGPDACWPFRGAHHEDGYGHVVIDGRSHPASRVAYLLDVGPADGLVIDHLCRNPPCCNPRHLEAVTNRENLLRGVGFPATNARKTHCPQGHEYTSSNTNISPKNQRKCKTCVRDGMRRLRARRRAAA